MQKLVKLSKRSRKSGRKFTYALRYIDEFGKERCKSLGHANRRKAEQQRAKKEKELRMGYVEPCSMRLKKFMEDSLSKTGSQIRESTRIDYREAMEDFIKKIGNIDFQNVLQTHGEQYRQMSLDQGASPATVAKRLRNLKRFFNLAVQRKQIEDNPLQYVRAPKVSKQTIRVYTSKEIDSMIKAASQLQNPDVLEWDIVITVAITTGMRKGELLNMVWSDIDFEEMTIQVTPKNNTQETWDWKIKDTDRRVLPLKEDVSKLLVDLQNRRPPGYPYVFVPPERYDHIQNVLRRNGKWTYCSSRNGVINNFTKQFNRILATSHVQKGTFHDIRKTAITDWFRQGLKEYEVMTLAGHANFTTTHKFYLAVANDLIDRAREATSHQVSNELLQRCYQRSQKGGNE